MDFNNGQSGWMEPNRRTERRDRFLVPRFRILSRRVVSGVFFAFILYFFFTLSRPAAVPDSATTVPTEPLVSGVLAGEYGGGGGGRARDPPRDTTATDDARPRGIRELHILYAT